MHPRVARLAIAFLPIFLPIATARAETLTYGVDAGIGETDNVTLVHNDKISQTMAVTDFDLDYKQKSQRFDVDAKGNFSYLDYLQNAYGSRLFGRFDGTAEVALIPQRLTWSLQEDFGQSAIDPFTPTTPANIENVNFLSTGPDLYLRLGGATFVAASARVARAQYETSPFTNTRGTGSLAWGLKLSPVSSVSVNADTQRVLFENTILNTDFDRTNVFGRYQLQGARTDLTMDIGATVVDEGGGSTTGGLAKLKVARKISPSALLTLSLGHDSTDGSPNFSGLQQGAAGAVGTAPATNSSENYTSSYGSVAWDYQRNRTSLGVSARWERDIYAGLPTLDRSMSSGEVRAQRRLTRAFTLQLTGRYYKSVYENVTAVTANGSPNNALGSIGASLTWHHGRALEVKLAGEHTTYTTSPNDTGYRENRVFLTVGYRPVRGVPTDIQMPGVTEDPTL